MDLRALSLALTLLVLPACGGDEDGGSPRSSGTPSAPSATASATAAGEENAVAISGIDYGFSVTGTPKQGLTRITFENTGQDFHMAAIARLNDGKSAADALTALQSEDESDDAEVLQSPDTYLDGNPSLLTPGARTTTYAQLAAGKYAIICFLPAKDDGQPHFAKGMISELTVGTEDTTMPDPTSTGEIVTDDESLTVPDLSSGTGTYEYTNDGEDDHGLLFVRLKDGETYESFIAWSDRYFRGEASIDDRPGDVWGGILAAAPGEQTWVTVDLPPGSYLALDTEAEDDDANEQEYYRDEYGGLRAEFTVT